jgi:hypothetical protein
MNMFQDIISMVREIAGEEALSFDYPVVIKTSPHRPAFEAWRVLASHHGTLYISDCRKVYHEVKPGEGNSAIVIASIYQRVAIIYSIIKKNEEAEQ